jgi:hypothetical protein
VKFSIGDRVLLKRSGEEGTITAFHGAGLVEVEVSGLHFPVYEDELEHPYLNWFTRPRIKHVKSGNEAPAPVEKRPPPRLSRGIYLSFLPLFSSAGNEEIIEAFRIHLINESAGSLLFSYEAKSVAGSSLLSLSGALPSFSNIFLHSLSLEEMNTQPRFRWALAPKEKPASGKSGMLRIRPAQLLRYMKPLMEEGAPSFSVLLAEDAEALPPSLPAAPPGPRTTTGSSKRRTHGVTEPVGVLDLHMESNGDEASMLLAAQLRLLEQKLHAAFVAGQERMIVIHGLGSGTLREAVHRLLRDTVFVKHFRNEWMAGYGWGATLIEF